jgi:acyl-CoA synthetase (AMP-forming)/AMP-acid ligase II
VTAGYFEDPTIPFYNKDGYFETGDLAYSIRGELVIAGRTGDRIKINGQSLFASDFEFSVQSLSFIRHGRAVVFQIDQKTILLAEVPGEGALTAHEQRAAIRDAIAKRLGVKLPLEDIRLIAPGQIKKTSSGKLKRRAMAQAFIDGTIRFAKHEASASESTAVRVREVSHA